MTEEDINKLNKFQNSGMYHPYTCCSFNGCNRRENNDGILIATKDNWICPCGKYMQNYSDSESNMILLSDRKNI